MTTENNGQKVFEDFIGGGGQADLFDKAGELDAYFKGHSYAQSYGSALGVQLLGASSRQPELLEADGRRHEGFHFHIEFHPPLRKPDLLKYLAGPEIGGGSFLSDTSPEEKAAELRAVPLVHYRLKREN